MLERYSVVILAFSIVIILLDFYLLRKHRIRGRGFVFWFLLGVASALFALVPSVVSFIAMIFGTEFTISAIMGAGFLFFTLAIFYLYYKLSELHNLLVKMAMEVSVAKYIQKRSSSKSRRKDKDQQ